MKRLNCLLFALSLQPPGGRNASPLASQEECCAGYLSVIHPSVCPSEQLIGDQRSHHMSGTTFLPHCGYPDPRLVIGRVLGSSVHRLRHFLITTVLGFLPLVRSPRSASVVFARLRLAHTSLSMNSPADIHTGYRPCLRREGYPLY